MSHDIVADGLNMIRNAKKARKETIKINIISNLLIEILKIMKQEGAIKRYKINAKDKSLDITIGDLEECKSIEVKKKFSVLASYQKYNLLGSFNRNYSVCHGSNFFTVIDARGDMYICCHHIRDESAKYGSLKTQTFMEILHNKSRIEIQKSYPCRKCVPFCRLHTQNILLEDIKTLKCDIVSSNLPPIIQKHSPFL